MPQLCKMNDSWTKEEKVSEWQDGVPPSDGIWEIDVPEHYNTYYCRFKDGKWGVGNRYLEEAISRKHLYYEDNNQQCNLRKWRGLIDE